MNNDSTHAALKVLRQRFEEAADALVMDLGEDFAHWRQTLDRKLLPRLNSDFPLVAAICGGGSAGKSTLFNTLAGANASPTGGRAGLNRRVLIGLHPDIEKNPLLWADLAHTFNASPGPVAAMDDLLTPGRPLYTTQPAIPSRVVLLDTPDIDTGAKGVYANRDLARQSLEIADLFIYIFTNATYNNRDITDFIAKMFTGMGRRPCYLVYRVYSGYSDEEVAGHADTVARHIYGPDASKQILGIFRADEDNAVADGRAPMQIRALRSPRHRLPEALADLDPHKLRHRLLASMLRGTVTQAEKMRAAIQAADRNARRYDRALASTQGQCVQEALSQFPTDRVVRRFAQIWAQTDPMHIKIMRRTGRVMEWPVKTLVNTVRKIRAVDMPAPAAGPGSAPARQLETDLLNAANKLYRLCQQDRLPADGRFVPAPMLVHEAQNRLGHRPWHQIQEAIMEQKTTLAGWSGRLDTDLRSLAHDLRQRMGWMDQIRQTFAALLNVIPATAAVTYILHTGDPMGAAGIKVKLTGLFGLHDLYALIAIPATAGMSRADRRQLEQLLGPLARAWLEDKLKVLQQLFESRISGEMRQALCGAQEQVQPLLEEIDDALATCRQAVTPRAPESSPAPGN